MRKHSLSAHRHGGLEDGAAGDLAAGARHHEVEIAAGEGDVGAEDVVSGIDMMGRDGVVGKRVQGDGIAPASSGATGRRTAGTRD